MDVYVADGAGDLGLRVLGVRQLLVVQLGLGLADAKGLVEGAPKAVLEGAKKEDAEAAKEKLEAAGAAVTIK